MKTYTTHIAALCAFGLGFVSSVRADVAIMATPGMDYDGSTVAVTGAGDATSATLSVAGNSYPFSLVDGAGSTVVPANVVAADHVYDATVTIGATEYPVRLYQGEVGYSPVDWFTETATDPTDERWTEEVPAVEGDRFVFVDDADELMTTAYTPTGSQSDRLAIVEMDVTFGAPISDDDLPSMGSGKAAVRLVEGNEGKFFFSCYANGAWQVSQTEASLDTVYTVRMTLDRFNKAVCYEAKSGAGSYVTLFSGSSSSVTAALANVAFSGEGTLGTLTGDNSTDTATAWLCQANSTKYKSINEAIEDNQTSMTLLWDASWFAPEETAIYTISGGAGGKALKVLGGWIAADTTLPDNTTLAGGKYTKNSGQGTVASDCRWASRVASDYVYEVLKGSTQIASDEKVYPVTDGTKTIDIAFSKAELVGKGIGVTSDMSDEQVQTKLNAPGSNKNPAWENVVLGLKNDDASSIPVVTPVQSSDATKITFALGGVNIDSKYNANVYYTVYSGSTAVSDPTLAGNQVAVALPASGVKYYQLKVDAAGAH